MGLCTCINRKLYIQASVVVAIINELFLSFYLIFQFSFVIRDHLTEYDDVASIPILYIIGSEFILIFCLFTTLSLVILLILGFVLNVLVLIAIWIQLKCMMLILFSFHIVIQIITHHYEDGILFIWWLYSIYLFVMVIIYYKTAPFVTDAAVIAVETQPPT